MEVAGIGNTYFDDYRISASSGSLAGVVAAGSGSLNFAEVLERAAASKSAVSAGSLPAGAGSGAKTKIDKDDKLYQLCLELETFLVKNLLTSMRNTVQKSGLIDEGFAGKMYEDMLYDEYAKDFTKNASFGLAEQAYLQLKGIQG